VGGVNPLVLEKFSSDKHHGILKVWLSHKGLSDVMEEGDQVHQLGCLPVLRHGTGLTLSNYMLIFVFITRNLRYRQKSYGTLIQYKTSLQKQNSKILVISSNLVTSLGAPKTENQIRIKSQWCAESGVVKVDADSE
jgi:hypothetical protein